MEGTSINTGDSTHYVVYIGGSLKEVEEDQFHFPKLDPATGLKNATEIKGLLLDTLFQQPTTVITGKRKV